MSTQRKQSDSIIFIGMPGSGKSTVGSVLAKALCMQFIDTDFIIQKRERMKLQQIIKQRGSEYFAKAEERVLLSLRPWGQVIATGGSAVFYPEAMQNLRNIGKIVYLDVSLKSLEKRLWNLKTRGIVFKPGQDIEAVYKERAPLYEKYCDFRIKSGQGGVDRTALTIIEALNRDRLQNLQM